VSLSDVQRAALALLEPRPFVNGRFVDGAGTRPTRYPATGEVLAEVQEADDALVGHAVRAAREAASPWADLTPEARRGHLLEVARLVAEHSEALALLETLDAGRTIADSRADAGLARGLLESAAETAVRLRSPVAMTAPDLLAYSRREPLGVVGFVLPWNSPLFMYAAAVPLALAAGNAVVLKPSEETPLVALALAKLFHRAGLPDGAFSVVPGDGRAGQALVDHPGVDLVSFTGSSATGREIASRVGRRLGRVHLELGGKSPFVVFADADLEAAAKASAFAFTWNQGQICTAGTRLIVERSVERAFLERLRAELESLTVGDPLLESTSLGAVISPKHRDRIHGYVQGALLESARLVAGGVIPAVAGFEGGSFYAPTVFADVRPEHRIAREEVFGPVLAVFGFDTEAEAVALANSSDYGLGATVWTGNLGRAYRMVARIEAGFVSVNAYGAGGPVPGEPFKASGLGVMGGLEGAEAYTRLKAVGIRL
jgi:acyl-CoA reductase-like NAD-dependent aldehyde dehydrogenase